MKKSEELFRKCLEDVDIYRNYILSFIEDGYIKNEDIISLLQSVVDKLDEIQLYIDFRESDPELESEN